MSEDKIIKGKTNEKQILDLMSEMLNLVYLHGHFLGEKDYYELMDKMQKLYKKV